jgi:hypothetical protein
MKMSNANKIRRHLSVHPNATAKEVAAKFGVSVAYVYTLRSLMKKDAVNTASEWNKGSDWATVHVSTSNESVIPTSNTVTPTPAPVEDVVNHPAHYKTGGIETIDFIEAKQLNYHLGNVVKYITRADHKGDRLENLKKAQWYLEREIAQSAS